MSKLKRIRIVKPYIEDEINEDDYVDFDKVVEFFPDGTRKTNEYFEKLAEEIASKGYTFGTSLQGFQDIAGFFPQTQVVAERFKRQPFTAQQAMAYQFGGDATAKKELETLRGLESGLFQGQVGATSTALGTPTKGLL